ncbi:MAG: HobA family DNA replication regulator [Campylobacteraceae bacterium]|jgi:hypothetical protein|nr:HobA family DNA replication regulator [Campylobacteraceae bacterium]
MQEFLKWTLDTIRKEGSSFSWMEEKRLEWVPLVVPVLKKLLQGHTFIVATDDERRWFGEYMVYSINRPYQNRPFISFICLNAFFPNINSLRSKEDFDLLEDMLSLSFSNGYTFFYVGKSNDAKYQISKQKYDSFLWIVDEQVQNSFYLKSEDYSLDTKMIQLFKLLNRSIDAVLFAEVTLED